jgi:hypothetical protein
MYTQTQTDTKIVEAKVELMERVNKYFTIYRTDFNGSRLCRLGRFYNYGKTLRG